MEKTKVIISLQITDDIYDALKKRADEECATVSYLIRRTLIKEIRNWKEEK